MRDENTGVGHRRPPSLVEGAGDRLRLVVEVDIDRTYFDEVVTEEEISFPDPPIDTQRIELSGSEIQIGRTNESNAIVPDLDITALTGDPAVSSRHAVIRPDDDGGMVILDVGSTNGTFLLDVESVGIEPGLPTPVSVDEPIYLGAWTRLTVVSVSSGQS